MGLDAGRAENLATLRTAVLESEVDDKPSCEQPCPQSEPKPASLDNSLSKTNY